MAEARPDYRARLHCKDPEEKELRRKLQELLSQISSLTVTIQRTPMPSQLDDIYLTRSSLHISQRLTFDLFLETLFELCLCQHSNQTLNLLFAFLEAYAGLLETEYRWCTQQNIPPED